MATEYSAEWVKVPDGNGGTKKVWLRDSKARKTIADKFAVASGTFASSADSWSSYVNYPTGFTQSNCVPCGFSVNRDNIWRIGDGVGSGSSQTFAQLGPSGIRVYNSSTSCVSRPWQLVLMRTDI